MSLFVQRCRDVTAQADFGRHWTKVSRIFGSSDIGRRLRTEATSRTSTRDSPRRHAAVINRLPLVTDEYTTPRNRRQELGLAPGCLQNKYNLRLGYSNVQRTPGSGSPAQPPRYSVGPMTIIFMLDSI